MEPTWRKPAGIIGMLIYLTLYAGAVAVFADTLALLPAWLMLVVYMLLGVAWIAPLRPLFLWMNTGRWTAPKADR
jgi:Protein of unknown function (DUF2842)